MRKEAEIKEKTYKDILDDIIELESLISPWNCEDDNWYVRDMISDLMEEALKKIRKENEFRL